MSTDAAKWLLEWNEAVMREARAKAQAEFEARIKQPEQKQEHPRLEI